jgi:hypothetical protein
VVYSGNFTDVVDVVGDVVDGDDGWSGLIFFIFIGKPGGYPLGLSQGRRVNPLARHCQYLRL